MSAHSDQVQNLYAALTFCRLHLLFLWSLSLITPSMRNRPCMPVLGFIACMHASIVATMFVWQLFCYASEGTGCTLVRLKLRYLMLYVYVIITFWQKPTHHWKADPATYNWCYTVQKSTSSDQDNWVKSAMLKHFNAINNIQIRASILLHLYHSSSARSILQTF